MGGGVRRNKIAQPPLIKASRNAYAPESDKVSEPTSPVRALSTTTPPGSPKVPPEPDRATNPVPAQPPTLLSHTFGNPLTNVTAKAAIESLHKKATSSNLFQLARALSHSYIDDVDISVCPYPPSNTTISTFPTWALPPYTSYSANTSFPPTRTA